jgi:chromate transport protein ChrA
MLGYIFGQWRVNIYYIFWLAIIIFTGFIILFFNLKIDPLIVIIIDFVLFFIGCYFIWKYKEKNKKNY